MNSRRTRYRIGRGKVKNSRLLPALQTETDCSCLCTSGAKSDEQPDRHLHKVQERIRRVGSRPNYRRAIPRIKVLLGEGAFHPLVEFIPGACFHRTKTGQAFQSLLVILGSHLAFENAIEERKL